MTDSLIYQGIAYRQSRSPDAPYLVSFVVTAEELLEVVRDPEALGRESRRFSTCL
jgi:hypothetical protein